MPAGDEKDRLGDKLRQAEKAREDQWARDRDQELLEKMRAKLVEPLNCPRCHKPLEPHVLSGAQFFQCPSHDGLWLERESAEKFLAQVR